MRDSPIYRDLSVPPHFVEVRLVEDFRTGSGVVVEVVEVVE